MQPLADMVGMWFHSIIICMTFLQTSVAGPTFLLRLKRDMACRDHINSRPADILVQSWDRGKPAAFDVTVASPLTPAVLNEASISAGAAAYGAENRKHATNDTRCQELGWMCIPLAVELYGNWGKEAQCVFSRLASLLAVSQSSFKPKMVAEIYGRLNLSLVRSGARAIVGRELAHE